MLTVKIQYSGDLNRPGNCPTGCCLSLYQVSNSPRTPPSVPLSVSCHVRGEPHLLPPPPRRPPRCWVFTAAVMIILVLW